MKTKKGNIVTDCEGVISVEYNIELSTLIGQCVMYDKDEIGTDVTDRTVPLYSKNEIELPWSIR